MTVTAASLGLTAHEFTNAHGIISAVKKRGWPQRAAIIAVEAALTESGMRILASANVPESLKYPHDLLSWTYDGLGHDHASCGMFQQQTGYKWALPGTTTMGTPNGWGTPAELMDPEKSTTKFLNALARVDWQHGTRWAAAQAVQRSIYADGSNYRQQDARAVHIVQSIWSGVVSKPVKPKPAPASSGFTKITTSGTVKYTVRRGDTLSAIAKAFKTSVNKLVSLNNIKNPNLIYIGQVLRVPSAKAVTAAKPTTKPKPAAKTRIVAKCTVKRGDTLIGICHRYPQAWITPASVARINGLSNPNHIVIGQTLRIGG